MGLHHAAFRCRNSEETRAFYEDFLGLPLVEALAMEKTKTGDGLTFMHTFYQLDDGSCIAFFELPDGDEIGRPFEFKEQSDFDVHMAFQVPSLDKLHQMLNKCRDAGIECRGPSDHNFVHSIYIRDPNGYVVELTTPVKPAKKHFKEAQAIAKQKVLEFVNKHSKKSRL